MFTRKIGSMLRGKASRLQIILACVLGGMLGFVPGFFLPSDFGGGFMQAPGLILSLVALVLILDANLALFGTALVVAKLVSIPLLPLSFAVGRFLLDGPLEGLFAWLVNAPVTAWFGFEYYATSGGLLIGLVLGLLGGLLMWRSMHALRVKMANVEEGSERYQKMTSKRSVRFLIWLFLGSGRGKKTWRELSERDRRGLGIRWVGLVVVVLIVAGLWAAQEAFSGAWLRERTQLDLTQWNGATVDLAGAKLDLAGGQLAFEGLAMADSAKLDEDLFRSQLIELDISTSELLAARLVADSIVSSESQSGAPRAVPGERVAEPVPPPPPPPPAEGESGKPLEDYLEDAKVWKARLEQAAEWIEWFSGEDQPAADESAEDRDQRIEQEVADLGAMMVKAEHLRAEHPAVTVRELRIEGISVAKLGDDLLDLRGSNLSSNPNLADSPSALVLSNRSGQLALSLGHDPAADGTTTLDFNLLDLAVDSLAESWKDSPLSGGTVALHLSGELDPGHAEGLWIDLPLQATIENTTVTVGGRQTQIPKLEVPLGIRGPLRNPSITVDDSALADALVAAGREELADEVRNRADKLLDGKVPGAGEELGGLIEGEKSAEEVLDEAQKRAEEEAEKRAKEELEKQLKKQLPGGFGGFK